MEGVTTISMDKADARTRFEEYRAALEGRVPTDEDRGILMGYEALAKGKALLDLHGVFKNCPADDKGHPRLAVARAHWRRCLVRIEQDGSAMFDQNHPGHSFYGRKAWHRTVKLPRETLPPALRPHPGRPLRERYTVNLAAVVPLIPVNLRPARGLNRYLVLWEAEWQAVPADPMLLRQLHGSLYAVLACWDLSALERAVLAGRLSERAGP